MLILVHVTLSIFHHGLSILDLRSWSLSIAHVGVDHGFGYTYILKLLDKVNEMVK